jgi:oxygen-dependent protoporphyrinogen oxidase
MRIAVVGAGLSGLARARALVARGEDVVLVEESDRPGGVVRSEKRDGYLLELGPNTVRPTPELWRLVQEVGLESEALVADPRTPRFVDFGGRLHRLPTSPGGILGTKLLSMRGKLRFLSEPFVRRGDPSGETVRDFFTRRLGREVAERLVEPFVSGIWGGRSDQLSIAQAFPSLARFELEAGSITKGAFAAMRRRLKPTTPVKGGLLSLRDGLAALPRRLADDLGRRAHFGGRAASLRRSGDRWKLATADLEVEADRICIATPAAEAARLVEEFAPDAAAALRAIPYAPLVVLHLGSPAHPARAGFGHLVVPQQQRRVLGAIWSSSLFPGRAPVGRALFTVFLGGARDPGAVDLSDDELVALASGDLAAAEISGPFEPIRVTRYHRAIPQYDLSHGDRIASIAEAERRFPGLSFLGSYRGGVSVGDVVRSALIP